MTGSWGQTTFSKQIILGLEFKKFCIEDNRSELINTKKIREVALLLREDILNLVKKTLPEKLTLWDKFEEKIQAPKMLSRFLQYLVARVR